MDLISENPYRTLGVFCGASTREIQKQLAKVKAFSRVGKQSRLETDFDFLGGVNRDLELITEAANKIEQAKNKVMYSLFWFQKANHIDETALGYLKKNETDKAIEIWTKLTDPINHNVSLKNFSAYLNISTILIELGFQNNDKEKITNGFQYKGYLISSDHFSEFVKSVGGENIVLNKELIANEVLSEVLILTKQRNIDLSYSELIEAFKTFPAKAQEELKKKFTEQPKLSIEKEIEFTQEMREEYPEEAYEYGTELYKKSKQHLLFLIQTLGKTNIEVKTLSNSLANEILQCSIDFFNNHQDDDNFDPGDQAVKLAKMAKGICPPGATLSRINENLETIQEWVDDAPERERHQVIESDLAFVTAKLTRFQNLEDTVENAKDLINSCKPKLQNMRAELGSSDDFYLKISSAVVGNAQGMLVSAVNEAQENFKNSQSLGTGQPQFHMVDGRMQMKLPKYISLSGLATIISEAYSATTSMESMDMYPNLRQQFLTNKNTIGSIKSQISAANRTVSSSSSSRSSGSGCYIATMVYGDYDHPKVMVLRNYRDEVLLSSIIGRIFVRLYYSISPWLVKILKNNNPTNTFIRKVLNRIINKIQK
jgi:hypothetical protein